MKIRNYIKLVIVSSVLTSCYSTRQIGENKTGNLHDQSIGKSKNEILRLYGVPDKKEDDGAGGQIYIYEELTQVSTNKSNASAIGNSYSSGLLVYDRNGVVGESENRNGQFANSKSITKTFIDKKYLNIFINKNDTAYDFRSNYGAYSTSNTIRCLNKKKTWSCALLCPLGLLTLAPIGYLVSIPIAITSIKKAKRNGYICPPKN